MMASVGMIRTLAMVLGPSVLGLLGADSGTIRILTMVGEAGIASLPVFVAWSVSGYLKTDTVLALFYGVICAIGMHTAVIATAFALISTQGYDSVAMVGAGAAAYACFGVYLAYTIFEQDKKQKQIGLSALLSHAVGAWQRPACSRCCSPTPT